MSSIADRPGFAARSTDFEAVAEFFVPKPSPDIPAKYWAPRIQALRPVKVYTHRVNVVVVQRIVGGAEEGKYIHIPVAPSLGAADDRQKEVVTMIGRQ